MSAKELTTTQAAERLNVGASTVRLWCVQGRFKNARQLETPRGSVWVISETEVDSFTPPKRGRTPKPKTEEAAKPAKKKGGKK